MVPTLPLTELVSHIIRVYTTKGIIELASYSEESAVRIARMLFKGGNGVYKVHVYQFKPERRILELV